MRYLRRIVILTFGDMLHARGLPHASIVSQLDSDVAFGSASDYLPVGFLPRVLGSSAFSSLRVYWSKEEMLKDPGRVKEWRIAQAADSYLCATHHVSILDAFHIIYSDTSYNADLVSTLCDKIPGTLQHRVCGVA